jgi:uncharacterized protein YbjQ (UPF0145 family)
LNSTTAVVGYGFAISAIVQGAILLKAGRYSDEKGRRAASIIGANIVKDFFAGIRDIVGGRSGSYEEGLREAKDIALREMQEQATRLGANAVIGVDLDYETLGSNGSMLMVSASGTAVIVEDRI